MPDSSIDKALSAILEHDLPSESSLKEAHQKIEQASINFIAFFGNKYPGKKYLHIKTVDDDGSFDEITIRIEPKNSELSVERQSKTGKISSTYISALIKVDKSICNVIISKENGEKEGRMHSEQEAGKMPVITNRNIGGGVADKEIIEVINKVAKLLQSIEANPGAFAIKILDEPPVLFGLGPGNSLTHNPQAKRAPFN